MATRSLAMLILTALLSCPILSVLAIPIVIPSFILELNAEARSLPGLIFTAPGPRSQPLSGGLDLRVMPLGASITYGQESSKGNGYRLPLREKLEGGNPVNMVGSRKAGSMTDNDNEGWPGFVVDQVYAKANASVPKWKPNLILINAGTNDCVQNRSISETGERMRRMINGLFDMSPRATVILSSLIVNKKPKTEANVLKVNKQYAALAKDMSAAGKRVVFADMHASDGPSLDDLADNTHPNDEGYRKMAAIWYRSIVVASGSGFLVAPEEVPGVPADGGK